MNHAAASPASIDSDSDSDSDSDEFAAAPAGENSTEEIAYTPLESQHIRCALAFSRMRSWFATLRTYGGFQQGKWWKWFSLWASQNLRSCPVFILPLLTALLIDRIDDGTAPVVMLLIIAWTNPWLLMIILLAVPIQVLLTRGFRQVIDRLNSEYCDAESSNMAHLPQALTSLRTVRAMRARISPNNALDPKANARWRRPLMNDAALARP